MAIALRGSASVPSANPTTSFNVTVDAAVEADDLLFLAVTSRDSTGAGSLSVTDNDTGGNTWTKIGNSTDHKATLWFKRATSGTASKTVTVSNAVGSASGVLKAFSGADTGATPYTNVVVETNASGNETHAGFTPDSADSMICASVHNYANDNAVTSLSFATAGATTATEKLSTGGSDCGCNFGHVLQTGGPTGTGDLTWAQTNGTTYSITWAIKVAAASTVTADISGTLDGLTAALEGNSAAAELAATLGGLATDIQGAHGVEASVSSTLAGLTTASQGNSVVAGINPTLDGLSTSFDATISDPPASADISATLGGLASASSGNSTVGGVNPTLEGLSTSFDATISDPPASADISGALDGLTSASSGNSTVGGASATLGGLSAAVSAGHGVDATVASTLDGLTASFAGGPPVSQTAVDAYLGRGSTGAVGQSTDAVSLDDGRNEVILG